MSSNLHIAVLLTLLGLLFTVDGITDLWDSVSGPPELTIKTLQTILWGYLLPGMTGFLIPPALICAFSKSRNPRRKC